MRDALGRPRYAYSLEVAVLLRRRWPNLLKPMRQCVLIGWCCAAVACELTPPAADATAQPAAADAAVADSALADLGAGDAADGAAGADMPADTPATPDAPASAAAVLHINEIAAAEDPDWFELYNPGSSAVALEGWTFADVVNAEPAKRTAFAKGASVPANGFLQVQVSDLLVGFKLGKDEELAVWRPNGELADSANWQDGDAPIGKSWARFPDGSGPFATTLKPTPGKPNEK